MGVEDVGEFDAVWTVVVEHVHSSEVVVQIDANEFVAVHDVVVDTVVAYQVVVLATAYPWLE